MEVREDGGYRRAQESAASVRWRQRAQVRALSGRTTVTWRAQALEKSVAVVEKGITRV